MSKAKSKKSRAISYILRFAVAAGALYWTFRGQDFGKIVDQLLELNLWIFAAAMGLWLLSQLIFTARWTLLMRVQSIKIGFWTAFRLHLLGVFYNNCLPTSVGGDLIRAGYVTTHTDKKLEAAFSVFVDRIIGLTGMIIMAFSCYWFIPVSGDEQRLGISYEINVLQRLSEYRWVVLGILGVFVIAFAIFVLNVRGRNLLRRGVGFVREHGIAVLQKIRGAIGIYFSKKLALVCALLLTFCCQGIFIIGLWLIGCEIGIDVHIKYYFIFFPVAWLFGALPISIGAAGIWEGMLKLMFGKVAPGIGEYLLLTLALCHRIIWIIGSLPGVIIHLVGAHLPSDFSVDSE